MQDEQRAELLYRALSSGEALPEGEDDAELEALAALGADLQRRGPELAMLAQAEEAFDPAFANRLHRTLLAAHPALPVAEQASEGRGHPAKVQPPRRRGVFRLLVAVGLLAMAVAALVLYSVLQNVQPGLQTGTAALTATVGPATGPTGAHLQTSANTRAPDAGVAPVPADSASLATPAPAPRATARSQHQAAHAHATSKAAASPPTASGGGAPAAQAFGAMSAGGPIVYKLPATLPTVPAEAPLYRLVPAPLSDRAVTRIVSRFPGMRPSAAPAGMDVYTVGRERLALLPATGQVDYTAGTPPSGSRRGGSPAPETAILRAHTWLVAHALYPNDVDESATSVQQVGGVTSVRFAPATDLPLTGADAAISLIVNLDGSGKVIAAHRIWPQVQHDGSVAILPPSAAVSPPSLASAPSAAPATAAPNAAAGAPRTFTVTDVTLAYAPTGSQLRPVYLLTGTLQGAGMPPRAYTQTVPATAPASP